MSGRASIPAILLAVLLLLPSPAPAREAGPGDDWCAAAAQLQPGEELALGPGDYVRPCTIRRGGAPGAPVTIRALDPARPPRLVYPGETSNVIDVRASHVVIRGLHLAHARRNVDGIRIHGADDVTIEDCRFVDVGGIAIVANATGHGLVVRRNVIQRNRSTAMYFGCHDGVGCTVTGIRVENNYVHGVTAPDPEIGYGVQIKLNSEAVIRDNVIVDTKGPPIMVYGATSLDRLSVVDANLAAGSQRSSGVVVGGGPAMVRNNIAIRNAQAGIALEDYQGRGLLRDIVVAGNTVHGNARGGIAAPSEGRVKAIVVNNAVQAVLRASRLPAAAPGLLLRGNVDCTLLACFAAPEMLDFSPAAGSPVTGRGVMLGSGGGRASRDYFGRPRALPPTVGAVEGPADPIHLGLKTLP